MRRSRAILLPAALVCCAVVLLVLPGGAAGKGGESDEAPAAATTAPAARAPAQPGATQPTTRIISGEREGFFSEYGGDIARWTLEHLQLAFLAMLVACVVAVPLGVALAHWSARKAAGLVISIVGLIQPIPSLALVALVGALFLHIRESTPLNLPTIGMLPGLVALIGYALLPILRNTYTGIRQVDSTVIEVATGMGMTSKQILYSVELPLALPFIMAGIRISMVWTIGVATLVSLVGAGGLGDPIFSGLSNNSIPLILAGAVPAIALALMFEFLLGSFERWLTPEGLRDEQSV